MSNPTNLRYFERNELRGKIPLKNGECAFRTVYEAMEPLQCFSCGGQTIETGDLFLLVFDGAHKTYPGCNECRPFQVSGGEPLGIDDRKREKIKKLRLKREQTREQKVEVA